MAQGLERIPLAVDSDFQAQPVRANFPDAPAQDFKLVSFEPDQVQAQPAPQPRSLGTVAADTAYGMAKGAGSLAKGIGWLTGSDGLQQAGQDAEDYWGEKQSADLHRQLEAVGKAEGVSGTVASLWNNPGAIGDYIATSLPMMIPGMAVGNLGARGIIAYAGNAARGAALRAGATEAAAMQAGRIAAEKAAEKAAMRFAVGANMLGEGAVSGGVTGAEVEKFALDHGATPEQAKAAANKAALMAGAWTTAGAGIGAGMETRAMLGRLKDSGIKGMVKNVAKEAAEEAIQNPGEDYAAYAGKVQFDPTQTFDPGKAATLGAVTGGAMGAGFHAAGRAGTIMRGEREDDNPDGAIPADDIGAGPGSGGPGAIEGTVLGPEQIADQRGGPITTRQPETYTQITPTVLPRLALPAPEAGGPSDRQVSTAIGLLKHSPKASPELLQRLMRVDQTMATMLFNHWQGQTNGQVTGNQATEIPAAGDQGQGTDIAGSRVMDGFSDGAVSFIPGAAAEDAALGGEPGMALGGAGPDAVTPLDVQAHAAATSPFNATPQPTEAQKAAGNYKVGRIKFQGMDISIENPAGSVRSGTDEDGKAWETQIQHHYGYIKGTVGKDKDHLDVFIKPGAQSARTAYVIDQINPKTGAFDEHKIVFGADSEADAQAIYHANYEQGWQGMGAITAMPIEQFKDWIKSGKTKKPVAYTEPKEVRTASRTPKAANSLLQAIVNRGGISREIMSDVGADPAGRYMPGLFTKTGTTDLSALAGYLFDEDGFHQIRQDSAIGPARELEDLIVRALGGEKVLSTTAMEKGAQAEETAKLKEKAQRLGVKTVARKLEDIAADVLRIEAQNVLDEETALEDEALVAYNETVDALHAAIGEDDAENFLEALASKYQDETHLNYLRSATADIQEKINEQALSAAAKPDEATGRAAEEGNGTGVAPGGARASGEEARPALSLSSQSEEELAARDRAAQAAEAQRLKDEQAAENKRKADAERGSFQLTGSDRPADVLAAHGQGGLFDSPVARVESDEIGSGTATVFEYDGQVPGFPDVLYRMNGNWHRDIGGGKLEVTGQRKGDVKLAEFMARYPQEWVENGTVEVRAGQLETGRGGRIIEAEAVNAQEEYKSVIDELSDAEIEALFKKAGLAGGKSPVDQKRAMLRAENEADIFPIYEQMADNNELPGSAVDRRDPAEDWDYTVANFPEPKQSVNANKTAGDYISNEAAAGRLIEWKREARRIGKEEDHSNDVIFSLFDASGEISKPWRDAGYDVRQYDIKLGDDMLEHFPMADIIEAKEQGKKIVGIIAQPPCTCFSSSGARWWKETHDAHDRDMVNKMFGYAAARYFSKPKEYTKALVSLVDLFVGETEPEFFVMENPVGRIATEMGLPKPTLIFDPHVYGNPYTKKTQLWGTFNPDLPTANVEPTQGSLMHKLWSTAEKNGGTRSLTPEGFAYAFFMANRKRVAATSEKQPADPVAESLASAPSEPGDDGVATIQGGAAADIRDSQTANERKTDSKGNPIYKLGDRVEYISGGYKGRHGAISQVSPIRMVTVMLGSGARNEGETTYYYHVKTDNGADFMASPEEIRFETEKPAFVVPDITVDGMIMEPRRVFDGIGYAKRSAEGARAAAQRARKADSIAGHKRTAALNDEKAAKYQSAWDTWAAKYPAEAEKIAPKPAATPKVAVATPDVAPGDAIKAAGLRVTKTTTKNGKPVWEVSGNTREHSEMLKRAGGRWYGPKKVWSFYNDDPTAAITLKLGGQVSIAGTPTIAMSDKGLQQIAASNQPAAEKAKAELEARDQADEVDLGQLFDDVLAEEMKAPKATDQFFVGDRVLADDGRANMKGSVIAMDGNTALVRLDGGGERYYQSGNLSIVQRGSIANAQKAGAGETAAVPKARWESYQITPSPRENRFLVREARGDGSYQNLAEFGFSNGRVVKLQHFFESPSTRAPIEMAIDRWRNQQNQTTRTAGQALGSAAVNTGKGLLDAIDGLGKLFGSNGSRLSMGISFDEDTYAKAKPLFAQAVAHFQDAGADLNEAMRAVVRLVLDKFGPQVTENMKDYIVRFMEDVKAGNVVYDESKEADNENDGRGATAAGTGSGWQRDGGTGAAADGRPGGRAEAGNRAGDRGDGDRRDGGGKPLDAMAQEAAGTGAGGQPAGGDQVRGGSVATGTGTRGSEPLAGGDRDAANVRDRPERPAAGSVAGNKPSKAPSTEGVSVSGKADFQISEDDALGEGGQKTKARNNIAAIRLLKKLAADDRRATPAEQKVLAKYVGWGGIKQIFDDAKADWTKDRNDLKALLTPEEYAAARRSMLDAHYTSMDVVSGMWSAAAHLGFKGGRVLEPSVGVGNFFGLMPADVRARSSLYGVELDNITAQLAQNLYPSATVANMGFQDVELPANSFDLVVGNPPFGKQALYDKNHPELRSFSIHNFFFAKAIDKVRPGGILQMVVSHHLMDAVDSTARDYITARADLIGAIRLPDSAFRSNAGTDVVTDIIFLKKREPGAAQAGFDWSGTKHVTLTHPKTGERFDFRINGYYDAHPEMIVGDQVPTGKMNNAPNAYNVEAKAGESLYEGLGRAVAALPRNVMTDSTKPLVEIATAESEVPEGTKVLGYYMAGSVVMQRQPDAMGKRQGRPVEFKDAKSPRRAEAMIKVRNALRDLMRAERADETDAVLATKRTRLNTLYDAFKKEYGYINQPTNRRAFRDDPDLPLLESLEPKFDPGLGADAAKKRGETARKPTAEKADIFTKRVLPAIKEVTTAATAQDALVVSLNMKGEVDPDYMVELYGKPWEQIRTELGALVFHNPNGGWEAADGYLSGNVKAKLKTAEAAAEVDPQYQPNVEALRAVIPADVPALKISVRLGSPWIPSDVMEKLAAELWGDAGASIKFVKQVARWAVRSEGGDQTARNSTWGVTYGKLNGGQGTFTAPMIFEHVANNKAIVIKENVGDSEHPVWKTNEPATEAIRAKAQEMAAKFKEWIWQDQDRRDRLASIYNENYNTDRRRSYDGSHLTLPGSSSLIKLRRHQLNAVWRAIQDRVILLDHVVGAGKTYEMAAIAMELRRLGFSRKPMFVVPNSLVRQWRDEFYKLYPDANVLAATESDFEKKNRKRFMAKIATGDWDAVIVAHSSFKKVGMPYETEKAILDEQLKEISDAIEDMKRERGDKNVVRDMERIKIKLEERMKSLKDSGGKKDDAVSFDELGVDGLFVDEAHLFKNLFYYSQMRNVTGLGNPNGSGRAFDLFVKTRYLDQQYSGKALIGFATGTPVSNSLVEMFTMQRYLAWNKLKENGLHLLDAWAGVYGDVQQVYEVHPSGTGYRLSTRFAKFVNLPSLMELYRGFADVITMDDLKQQAKDAGGVFPVPKIKGTRPRNIVAERSDEQRLFFGVPEFGRDDKGGIAFKHEADLMVRKSDKDGKWYPWKPNGDKVGTEGFDTVEQATAERDTLIKLPVVGWNSGSILWKFENLKELTKNSKGKINALSITNEARKAGLDYRLIDPMAPDFPGSKINLAVKEAVRIYRDWSADKGAQLMFCDLSVPKTARAAAASKERDAYVRAADGSLMAVKATVVTIEGVEASFLAVKRGGKGAEGGYVLYDGLTGAHTGIAEHQRKDAVDALKAKIDADGLGWLEDLQDRYGEITDADIADYKDTQGKEDDAAEDEGDDGAISVAELMALAGGNTFSVYDDIKTKLIAAGIPEGEIAFIHDFDTAIKKNGLFKKVRSGEIRILLGSTEKMGAGMNVQERLVALHHLDAPWRPSDLEQREGRIIRQGNKLYERDPDGFEVELMRYGTRQTYDTRMWQIIEHKAAGVEQLRKAGDDLLEIDDVGGEAANAADMKAAASGNPLILDEIKLRNEAKSLEAQQFAYIQAKASMQDKVRWYRGAPERAEDQIAELQPFVDAAEKNPADPFSYTTPDGKVITDKKDVALPLTTAFADAAQSKLGETIDAGKYRGLLLRFRKGMGGIVAYLGSGAKPMPAADYGIEDKFSPSGIFTRLDNALERVKKTIADHRRMADQSVSQIPKLEAEIAKPFAKEDALKAARARHREVVSKLQKAGGGIELTPAMRAELDQAIARRTGVIAEPSSSAPGQFTSPRLGTKFANAREAIEWLAQNMDGEGYRHVAQKILPVVRSVPIHYVSVGDTVPAKVAELLSSGSAAVAYQAGDIADGKDAIYVLEGKGDTEEGLLHEALHSATSRRLLDSEAAKEFSDIARTIRGSLYDAGAKSTDEKFKQAVEFFRREFRSPGELVAYGFSSPAFQDLLKLMAADGKFYTDYRTPAELAKVNKNATFQPQKRIPTPAYSMWHRLVDAVRALFGGAKAYQEAYERAIAANAAIDRNNELASRVEFKTLEEKLHSLLDELLKTQELSLSQKATAQPIRVDSLESRSRSTGFASTESTRSIQAVVDKFLKQFAGASALNIRVVRTVADIPERFRPSPFAEGVFHDDAGLIYLIGMNLKHANGQINTGRVWQVLMHEAVGHFGLAQMMGEKFAGIVSKVKHAAKAKGTIGDDIYEPGNPDYATMEAVKLRYPEATDTEVAQEVLARMAETDPGRTLFGYVRAVVRQWLRDIARAAGIDINVTTAELNDMVALASRYMRRVDAVAMGVSDMAVGGAASYAGPKFATIKALDENKWQVTSSDGEHIGTYPTVDMARKVKDSNEKRWLAEYLKAQKKAGSSGMESRSAPTSGQAKEPRTGILDTILRKAGGELAAKITGPAYDKLTAYLGGKVPEGVKAGMVSDYGLDESYVDRRTGMQTEQQKAARQTKTFVEGLMDLDRAQSRVAYQWLNNRGAEADRLMAQLPEESRKVLEQIKGQIKQMTVEAVRLGQLDAETAARNWGAYLHRSYAKYDLNTDDKTWKAERAKAIKILGEQYKGRGLKMDIDPDRIHSAPGWWQDEMKGKRVKMLRSNTPKKIFGKMQHESVFVAEGTAIPSKYADYKLEGIWEIRSAKTDDRITLWRDFTDDERQMMGELDEAKYAVARTLFMMNRDIEIGRFHEWVADEYAKTPEEAADEGLQMADASDSMMRAFTPDEWVTVPTAKIPGTGVFKYGALAGMVVPGPVWNDIRQISAGRFEPFGAAYASILRAWKLSKTALTPTTHVNNIMGNFVMADMHDVGARDAIAAVRLMVAAANGDKDAKAMLDRFEDSGATQGMFTTHELKKEVLEPLLQQLREEVGMADDEAAILKVGAIMSLALHGQFGEAWAGAKAAAKQSKAGRVTGAVVTKAQDYYQAEDSVFRLAAFLKSIDEGKTDREAGKLARKAFLDYHINAPWINAMRGTAMPFIAFAYRAIPMLAETAARKPWKIAKYMLVAGGLNALAYAMLGADADEDKERAYLPDEKAGRLWGIVPKLIRMPWNRESKLRDGSTSSDPVFLDVRRWIPVGDVVDYGQDKTALPMIPQPLMPGGPLIMAAEFLVNKSAFTGKELTKETDTWVEKAAKVGGHFYKGFAPNVPIPYSGTWAGTKIDNAIKGKEDPLGRAYPVPEAIASGFGLKLERYPIDTLQRNAVLDMKGKLRELSDEQRQAARDYGRHGMTKRELDDKVADIVVKKNAAIEEYKAKERRAMGR